MGLLALRLERDGQIPPTTAYAWRNLPLDVRHVLTYFVAHEGHHRGQIVLAARQLGHRLPASVRDGLWQWTKRAAETRRVDPRVGLGHTDNSSSAYGRRKVSATAARLFDVAA